MARVRQPEHKVQADSSAIPAELQDHDSDVWLDLSLFEAWFVATFDSKPAVSGGYRNSPFDRFDAAVQAWSTRNGYLSERWPTTPDWARLAEIGIRRMGSLKRCELNWLHRERYGPADEPQVMRRPGSSTHPRRLT